MIDQKRLDAIRLSPKPRGQRLVGWLFLTPNYRLPFWRTNIIFEGAENLNRLGGNVIVMNHTDRYNYWPFQYELWRRGYGYTATWVKGKYYENHWLGWFMDAMNNIPVPSKGYVISKDFALTMERAPTETEYEVLKRYADGAIDEATAAMLGGVDVGRFLNRPWPGGAYADDVETRFSAMMQRVVEINRQAVKMGLNLLIFPQGTRTKRLTRGHTGAAQMILDTGAPVIPVGCNGSDRCYPGNSPWSRGGTIVYRIGKPLVPGDELRDFVVTEPFVPFTRSAEKHQETFRQLTDYLMDRINDLLDPEYRYGEEQLATGAARFL